jgi:CRISPR system Cascade subunit CasA
MNLVRDPWIPVQKDSAFRHLTLKELLCRDGRWTVSLPRDDLEMACLQLLIALTQALFTPKDLHQWLKREKRPLSEAEFDAGTAPFADWFDLDHEQHPFMQTRGVETNEVTPIQKLFVGLPEGNNHAFFNRVSEIGAVCPSCAAIALYNQAASSPSFGGGFKAGLRGNAPITTLVHADDLRKLIWRNVLHGESLDTALPGWRKLDRKDAPVWRKPIQAQRKMRWPEIGLKRGLFWQSARLELTRPEVAVRCNCCGAEIDHGYTGFYKEKFNYTLEGQWPHPLSPRQWEVKKNKRQERFLSFRTTAPAWTQLTQFVLEKDGDKEGFSAAPVVHQYRQKLNYEPDERLFLLVGGYRNKQAAVLERRHELFNLAASWVEHGDDLAGMVSVGLEARNALRGALYGFFKNTGIARHEEAQAQFYRRSEPLIHGRLREMDFQAFNAARDQLAEALSHLAQDIFDEETQAYRHRPEIHKHIALARRGLCAKLNRLKRRTA